VNLENEIIAIDTDKDLVALFTKKKLLTARHTK